MSTFSAAQKKQLLDLIGLYVRNLRDGHARVHMSEVEQRLDETYFAWIGGTEDNAVYYYRIHSPVILIEFDHETPVGLRQMYPAGVPYREHIHAVVRTPNGNDYGKDLRPPTLRGASAQVGRVRQVGRVGLLMEMRARARACRGAANPRGGAIRDAVKNALEAYRLAKGLQAARKINVCHGLSAGGEFFPRQSRVRRSSTRVRPTTRARRPLKRRTRSGKRAFSVAGRRAPSHPSRAGRTQRLPVVGPTGPYHRLTD